MRRARWLLPSFAVLALAAGAVRGGPVDEARVLSRADRPEEAEAALEAEVRRDPADAEAFVALGDVRRQRCQLGLAAEAYRRALEQRPLDADARAGWAEVLLLGGDAGEAWAQAHAAVEAGAAVGHESGRAWRAVALALVELRRYDLAVDAGRRAVSLAPDDARCAEALAAAEFRAGRMEAARDAYRRATELDPRTEEANLRLGNGFGPEIADRPWRDGADRGEFEDALRSWDRGDLEDTERRFLALAERTPDAYKYRLGVGLTRLSLRRRHEAYLGGDPTSLYLLIPVTEPEDVEALERLVPGYRHLGPLERRVVRVATEPARPFWGALVASGANHEVLPLAEDLTDDPRRQDLRHRRTFDGRWYEHLRGVAGPEGATGEEKLREAAEFAFNTFAHEFGHQVHRQGLSPSQQEEVRALYERAVREGACLDYYAASNVDEYFAQGYEAFVSPLKRGCLTETARHTRDDLARRDPPLLAFLTRVLDTSQERPEAIAALLRAARSGLPPALPEPSGH